ncbi:MAG: iron ABC transporter permease [Anaerolineae bacterium]|jgi:thiamine transport system permease protein|nr:iron ABC transporter permease [Anaerolineae bacterium]
MGFTLGQATLSTAITLVTALPGAYVFAHYEFPFKRLAQALTTVPFVLPTVVVATAFGVVLGPESPLVRWLGEGADLRYSLGAILLAHVFYNYTVVLRMVGGFWETLDPQLGEAARTLGASSWRAFWTVTFPLILPVVFAAGLLVFIFCFTSFGVVLILGGPTFATLEVEIYRQTIQFANLPLAAALSLVQITFTLILALVYARLQGRLARPLDFKPRSTVQRRPRKPLDVALVVANLLLMLVLLAYPLVTLVFRSLVSGSHTYALLFENPRQSVFYVAPLAAVWNSVRIALMTMGLALILGLLVSTAVYRRRAGWLVDALFMLPLGTSAVTLGLGYLLAMAQPPFNLRGSVALIVAAHSLVALPFVVRSLLPALKSIRPSLREAAQTLGAAPPAAFREVDLPIVWRALTVGAIFAFTISMGEFGATAMIARADLPTIPVAVYRFLSRPGALNYGQALAMSTILMAVCVVGFVTIEGIRPPGAQDF